MSVHIPAHLRQRETQTDKTKTNNLQTVKNNKQGQHLTLPFELW